MRKILVVIDCDTCHLPFPEIAATNLGDPMHWQAIAGDLEYSAEKSGWHSYQGEHHCFECLLDAMHPE